MREIIAALLGLAVVGLLVVAYQNHYRYHRPLVTATYYAVTLLNGDVVYGQIAHLGSDYPVLRNAFQVRTEIDTQTQQSRQVLVKRKDGPNGADHVIFPATAIVSVEPVRPDSPVGRLIAQEGTSR